MVDGVKQLVYYTSIATNHINVTTDITIRFLTFHRAFLQFTE